jgi:hypothetical protein
MFLCACCAAAESKELQERMNLEPFLGDEASAAASQHQRQHVTSSSTDSSILTDASHSSEGGHHTQQSAQYTDEREHSGMSRSETFCSTSGDRK